MQVVRRYYLDTLGPPKNKEKKKFSWLQLCIAALQYEITRSQSIRAAMQFFFKGENAKYTYNSVEFPTPELKPITHEIRALNLI